MKTTCYKIDGNYYIEDLCKHNKISIEFFLVCKQIDPMLTKSKYTRKSGVKISKEIFEKSTNKGVQKCKKITVTNYPFFIELFMNRTGLNFSEKSEFARIIHAPNLFRK